MAETVGTRIKASADQGDPWAKAMLLARRLDALTDATSGDALRASLRHSLKPWVEPAELEIAVNNAAVDLELAVSQRLGAIPDA